jgi:hypothetical protein
MPRKRIADLTPILTEAQRQAIRDGYRAPGLVSQEELDREVQAHNLRIVKRAEEAGLEINPRDLLGSTDTWLSRLKVAERAVRVKKPKLVSREPLEDGPTTSRAGL